MRAWLQTEPALSELREAYPGEWTVVERELLVLFEAGDRSALPEYVRRLGDPASLRPGAKPTTPGLDPQLAAAIRQRMAAAAIRGLSVRAATGVASGSVRFGRVNGTLAQRLLFRRGLERKPVSLRWFRVVWPLLTQRRRLMPLVQPQGIYCFYSGALIDELATIIDGRPCLEVAAGDGTLARFLTDHGTAVTATDDHSWNDVAFAEPVERLDARAALRKYEPQVVLCSWPPAGNDFEASVFSTPSVQTYVVIGNRHRPGWGNQRAYADQQQFTGAVDERLSRLVLPPELDPLVCVFQRKPAPPG